MQTNSDYNELLQDLGIKLSNTDLLNQAFTHKSYVNEVSGQQIGSNERLEFLGDAVLELVITKQLFLDFPQKEEGDLTSIRSALVRGKNLSKIARTLKLGQYLLLSKGEHKSNGQDKGYIIANLVEALIGAIYLAQGLEQATSFIIKHVYATLPEIMAEKLYIDSKTMFQELSQEKLNITPTYKLENSFGPDHSKKFSMGVYLDETKIAEGQGSSKQKAEQDAALKALQAKGWS